ncbi:MAG: C4-dicarboxylate TRAP transporter substrate-binding protein [Gammaproteobacteria bacterium]|nr:C4-dicarboxylate TRAP transporter substrate-binding protein [Gammaproteobacteria bacterium]
MYKGLKLGLVCLVAVMGLWQPAIAETKVTYGSFVGLSHTANKYGMQPFIENVEKATGGSMKIELHPGGAIASGKATASAIRDGLMDGGLVVALYTPSVFPVNTLMSDMGFHSVDPIVSTAAVTEATLLHCPQCLEEWRKNGIEYFGAYTTPSYKLMCKDAVNNLSDIKGRKMRSAGSVFGNWAKTMEGIPVSMPNAEAYEALERGQLDCIIGSSAWLKTLSLWDMVKYVVEEPMGAYMGGAIIDFNTDVWAKFSPKEKEAILRETPAALIRIAFGYVKDEEEVAKLAKEKGVNFVPSNPELSALKNQFTEELNVSQAEVAKKRGVKDPEAVIDAILKSLKKWEKIVAEVGYDQDKLADRLYTEVFSKIKY